MRFDSTVCMKWHARCKRQSVQDFWDKEKKGIERDVLVYLDEHPDGGDTLEGIIAWWLLERNIKYQADLVQDVIDGLVKRQLLLKNSTKDARIHYIMNKKKLKHIRTLLH